MPKPDTKEPSVPSIDTIKKLICGLQGRTTILLLAVVLAATGVTGAIFVRMTSKMLLDQTRSKARDVARAMAWSSADAVTAHDSATLLAVAEEMLTDSELCYVLFTDVSGQLITSYQRGAGNISHLLLGTDGKISVEPIDSPKLTVHRDYGTRIDIVYPIRPLKISKTGSERPTVGYIRVGLDASRYEARLGHLSIGIMGLSCAIALLTLPLGYQVVRNIVQPIQKLNVATSEIADGNLAARVHLNRADEIGALANTFDVMADHVEVAHEQLVSLNEELESRVKQRTEALEEANERLRDMAARDSLTGLFNRRHFNDFLSQLYSEVDRYGGTLTCMMLDLDNFKQVNDSLGHKAGDELLRITANVIERSIRDADIAVRYGGDEFVILMPQTTTSEAQASAERILSRFITDLEADMPEANIATLSIGLASQQGPAPGKPMELVQLADEALYLAKSGGKNRITILEPNHEDEANRNFEI